MYFDEQVKGSCRYFTTRLAERKEFTIHFLILSYLCFSETTEGPLLNGRGNFPGPPVGEEFSEFRGEKFCYLRGTAGRDGVARGDVGGGDATSERLDAPSPASTPPPSHPRPGRREASCCATRVLPTNWYPQLLTSPRCSRNHRRQNYPLCPEPVAYARYSPQKEL